MPKLSSTRSTPLASEIRHFAGWHLLVHCPRCYILLQLVVDELMRRIGGENLRG
jgi:hypothetical protein